LKIRKLYYNTVYRIFNNRLIFESLYPELLVDLNENEKRRLINLVNQFFRKFSFLEKVFIEKIEKKFDDQELKVAILLLCAAVEYTYLDKSVGYAVVNDYVEIAKRKVGIGKSKFINALLRKFTALDKEELRLEEERQIKETHPDWVVEKFEEYYGEEVTEKILKFNQTIPPVYIRANRTKTTKDELIATLASESVKTEKVEFFEDYLEIIEGNPVITKAFENGLFYIQNPSSSIPVKLLNPKKNQKVLDLCCAPGGKATYIQELTKDKVTLYLNDVSQKKRVTIKKNFKRLGLTFKKITFEEAEKFKSFDEFDKVLIDAPCSGSGNFRRHPESRWSRDEENLEDLKTLQFKILDRAKIYVRLGGSIIYSTCSIFKDENIEVINRFLEENEDYELRSAELPELERYKDSDGGYTVNPAIHGMEGAFAARIVRIR